MRATLTFKLPQEEPEHSYALAGLDALLAIDEIRSEIRSFLKHECGQFKRWKNYAGTECTGDYETLERVMQVLCTIAENRRLPELV